jgi:hypothetical protein
MKTAGVMRVEELTFQYPHFPLGKMRVAEIEISEPPKNRGFMRVLGFEPKHALSNVGLNDARLTTPAYPHDIYVAVNIVLKTLCKWIFHNQNEVNSDAYSKR